MASKKGRILVLGGSGRTGQLLIAEASRREFAVTALIRDAASLQEAPGLTIIQGSPTVLEDIQRAVNATDDLPSAIISTLGQTRRSGNPWAAPTSPPRFVAEAISNAVTAAKENNKPKLIVMSMCGVGDSLNSLNFLMRFVMRWSNMARTLEDHNLVDRIVKDSGLKFVLARPTMLRGDDDKPVVDLGDQGKQATFMPSISRKTVVSFLLDAVENDSWDGRTPVLSS